MTATTPFTTPMTVPTRHVRELMARLASAGFTVLDTGERVTTDAGLDAETTLHLIHVPLAVDPEACVLGVPR